MECTFDDVRIGRCSFAQAEFTNSRLKGLDFSESDISGITVGINELKGAVMNTEQAVACARLMGIVVKE